MLWIFWWRAVLSSDWTVHMLALSRTALVETRQIKIVSSRDDQMMWSKADSAEGTILKLRRPELQ